MRDGDNGRRPGRGDEEHAVRRVIQCGRVWHVSQPSHVVEAKASTVSRSPGGVPDGDGRFGSLDGHDQSELSFVHSPPVTVTDVAAVGSSFTTAPSKRGLPAQIHDRAAGA
jgi:hypothetical protein